MKRAPGLLHPIQVVVRRTGLSADVIRVWERRYGAVRPVRSGANRRLYSDEDVDRLQLLARATGLGRGIGQVAGLSTSRLRALVESDQGAQDAAPRHLGAAAMAPRALLDDAVTAVRALDPAGLDAVLGRAAVALPRAALLEELMGPLLRRIGDLWQQGELRIAHEHLASVVVRNCLAQFARAVPGNGAPVLLAATPAGQQHEFGALLAALEAEAAGFRVAYLGPDLPVDELAGAAAALDARVVALSIVYPADDPRLGADLGRLRRLLGAGPAILAGGAAASAYGAALAAARAELLPSLAALRARLPALRARRPAARG